MFGAKQQGTPSLFGQSTQQQQPSSGSIFGQAGQLQQQQSSSGAPTFLGGTTSSQPQSSIFGSGTTGTQQPQTGGLFGNTLGTQQPQTGGLFGNTATTTQPQTGSLFGASTATQPQTGSLFGASNATQPQTGSLFGASTTTQPQTGGLFGTSTATQPQTGSLFGASTATQPQTSSLFGASTATQPQTSSLFGASTATQPQTGSLFGANAATQPQTGSLFGASTTTQSQPSSLFGANATTQPQTGGLFGANTTNQPQTSLFGSTTGSSGGGLFGTNSQSQQQTTGSAFGGGSFFGSKPQQTQQQQTVLVGSNVMLMKTTKFNDLPEDMRKELESLDTFIQSQSQISKDLHQRKLGEEPMKGYELIKGVNKDFVNCNTNIRHDLHFMRDLKAKVDRAVGDTIVATRIVDGFRNPQGGGGVGGYLKEHAGFPFEFFSRVTEQIAARLSWYKATIEQIERKLTSTSHAQSPHSIAAALQAQHQTFLSLASKTAALDAELQKIKTLYTQLWRQKTGSMRDPFDELDKGAAADLGFEALNVK